MLNEHWKEGEEYVERERTRDDESRSRVALLERDGGHADRVGRRRCDDGEERGHGCAGHDDARQSRRA